MKGVVLACVLSACVGVGCALFGSSEGQLAAKTASDISRCQGMGREAGSYKAYDECMVEAGLHDGGAK